MLQLSFSLGYLFLVNRAETIAQYQNNSKTLLGTVNWIMVLLSTAMNSGFAYYLSGDRSYARVGRTCLTQAELENERLSSFFGNRHRETDSFTRVADAVRTLLVKAFDPSDLKADKEPSLLLSPELKCHWTQLFDARSALLAAGRKEVLANCGDLPAARALIKVVLFGGVAIDIIAAAWLIYFYHSQIATRLGLLAENTTRIAKGLSLPAIQNGDDEIADLDKSFHDMANKLTKSKRELENSEERLRNLFENMPVGLLTTNRAGLIQSANSKASAMLSINEADLEGKKFHELFRDANLVELFEDAGDEGKKVQSRAEIAALNALGEESIFEMSMRENQFHDEAIQLVVLQDITERRAIEKLRGEFLQMVTHDLRSPLTSILLAQQNMLRGAYGDLPEKVKGKVLTAERNAQRMLKLINSFLDFERLRSGTIALNIGIVHSDALVLNAKEAVEDIAVQKGLTVEMPTNSCEFSGDKDRLLQVLVNLLSNAIKFSTPDNCVRLILNTDDQSVEFQVQDFGRGIPPEFHEAIFEKYRQVKRQDFTEKGGTGLGLPICKEIVEQHGGKIGLISAVGSGSTFWFRLPRTN